jgi:Tfp pilus assembly protein PilF
MSQERINEVMMKATSLADGGDFIGAVEMAEELIKEYPDFVPGLCFIGDIYLHLGSPVLAVDPLEKAVNYKPDFYQSHYLLGCALGRTMNFQRAIHHLKIADKLEPNHTEINRNLGWMLCMIGELAKGRKILNKAITIDETNSLACNDMAVSYMIGKSNSPQKAKLWFEKALELDPQSEYIRSTYESFMKD